MSVAPAREYVLALSCQDKPGNVYSLSSFQLQHSANTLASQQCGESLDVRFFMRAHFSMQAQNAQLAQNLQLARFERGPSAVTEAFHMSLAAARRVRAGPRILIMVFRIGCPASRPTGQEFI